MQQAECTGAPGTLLQQVQQVFASNGVLARVNPDYRPRPGQLQMAQAITEAIANHGVIVVEAGTGVGKTFAYLVPALLSGERVLVSTATKTLQDQLFSVTCPICAGCLACQYARCS